MTRVLRVVNIATHRQNRASKAMAACPDKCN